MRWPLVVASRRVLGVRIGTVRALLGAAVGWAVAARVMLSLFPVLDDSTGALVGMLIPIAGATFLATLTVLFLAEMAFPGGTAVVGRLRSLRRRFARARRYSQASRIAVRHGIGRYLAGRRRGRRAAGGARPVAAPRSGGRRGHVRQARPGAVDPCGPAVTRVRRRAVPAAGPGRAGRPGRHRAGAG